MVIQKFNRIIRNKWIWGAFAFAISGFFAFDFLLTGGDVRENSAVAGELDGIMDEDEFITTAYQSWAYYADLEDVEAFYRESDDDDSWTK